MAGLEDHDRRSLQYDRLSTAEGVHTTMLHGAGEHTYEQLDGWAKLPEGMSFHNIGGLFIDPQDRVHVVSRGSPTQPIMVLDRAGNVLRVWGEGIFNHPHGICIGPDGCAYVADDGNHTVSKFSPDGTLLFMLGNKDHPSDTGYSGKGDQGTLTIQRAGPPFNRPTNLGLSSTGDIFVSDGYGNARVHRFAPDGTLLFSWGEPGTGPGQFRQVHSLRVDRKDRIWVCDRENSRIQIFDTEGNFLGQWADVGGQPSDLWFDYAGEGTVYVAVKSGPLPHGISIFTMDGKVLARWGETGAEDAMFWNPHAIAVDSKGDVYQGEMRHHLAKTDAGHRALQKFVRKR